VTDTGCAIKRNSSGSQNTSKQATMLCKPGKFCGSFTRLLHLKVVNVTIDRRRK
jgi:hypothetical protein